MQGLSWGHHDCCQMHLLSAQARHDIRTQLILMLPDLNWCSPREGSEFIFHQWEIPQEMWTSGNGSASYFYCRGSSWWLTATEGILIISSLWSLWLWVLRNQWTWWEQNYSRQCENTHRCWCVCWAWGRPRISCPGCIVPLANWTSIQNRTYREQAFIVQF